MLDKVFFPAYQKQDVGAPIFIIGNYRSGTTFLHRLLLKDEQLTCLKTWEIYFASAVIYRKFFKALDPIFGGFVRWIGVRFNKDLAERSAMHETGMDKEEEDSQLFFQIFSSYNMFALFPFPRFAKKYIYYDQRVSPKQKKNDMEYYREVLRRHVYLSGGKRYLSKNPDFSPRVETLREYFPDAKFINIVRAPVKVVPSTIKMWAHVWKLFGTPKEDYPHKDVLIEHAKHWYKYPHQRLRSLPSDRYAVIEFSEFVSNPKEVITRLYSQFGLEMGDEFAGILQEATGKSRHYKSNNPYSLSDMGLDEDAVNAEFLPVLQDYEFNVCAEGKEL
ncbi:MAG: sulfotransferase [Chloroflexota bacterium]|nr:sulfotransferase [Chloroflexota bacterium]